MATVTNRTEFPTSPWQNLAFFGAPPAAPAPVGFSINPQPQTGKGAFGMVPGPIGIPGPFGNVNQGAVSSVVNSHIAGQLSPEEQAAIQDIGARFGVTSGMPGSGLARNRTMRDYGLATGVRQAQGLAEYNALVPGAVFQAGLAERNALNAAAPDPTQRASYAKQLFDQYLAKLSGGGGGARGPGGGTGSFAEPVAQPPVAAGFPNPVNAPANPNLPSSVYAPPPMVFPGAPYDMPPAPMIDPFANGYVGGPPPEDWEEGLF